MFAKLSAWENSNRRLLRWALFGFAIICFIFYLGVLRTPTRDTVAYGKTDLAVFYVAGATITGTIDLEPAQLYKRKPIKAAIKEIRPQSGGTWFLYPPASALFFAPFSLVDFKTAASVWQFVDAVLFLTTLYLVIRFLVGDRELLRYRYSLLILALTFAGPVGGLMQTGQINGVIWLLMIGGSILVVKKHPWLAGIAFGVATSIKVFPILFLPYLILKRQWKAAASFIATGLALLAAAVPFFGTGIYQNFLKTTFLPLAKGSIGTLYKSVSLYGSFRKSIEQDLFAGLEVTKKQLIDGADPYFTALAVLGLLITALVLWRRRKTTGVANALIDYTIIISFFLVFSKNVHSQYAFWLIPFIVWALSLQWKTTPRWLTILVAVAFLLTEFAWLLFGSTELIGPFKPMTIGLVIIFALGVIVGWSKRSQSPGAAL